MGNPMVSFCPGNQSDKAARDLDTRIRSLFAERKTWASIASELNLSERTVRYRAKALGLSKHNSISRGDLGMAMAACSTDREVAERLGTSVRTVIRLRERYDISASRGGKRVGAGRKPGQSHQSHITDPKKLQEMAELAAMREQQIIDARVNSIDARVRTTRIMASDFDLLRWAPSAFVFDRATVSMVAREECWSSGMPQRISVSGNNFMPGESDGNRKAGRSNVGEIQAMKAAQGQ